jgi:flagella synthesis protein FlgN
MQNQTAQLVAALTAERIALQSFVALLENEQSLLVENSTETLLSLCEQKSEDAISLNKLAELRRDLMKKSLPSLSAEAVQDWLKTQSPLGLSLWQELRVLAERAQQLNSTNGELIHMKMRHNQQSLNVLTKAVNKASLYGPDGQTTFSPGSGRSLGSG